MKLQLALFLASVSAAAAGGNANFGQGNGNRNGANNNSGGGSSSGGTGTSTTQALPLTQSFIRSFTGVENRFAEIDAELLRVTGPAFYPDEKGIGVEGMFTVPNARGISNIVAQAPAGVTLGKATVSDMLWQWGQFMDHDIGLTEGVAEAFEITSPDCTTDPICNIAMQRSLHHFTNGVREQLNEITGFLDASMVYGHTVERAEFLREFSGGRMKMTAQGLLPDGFGSGLANALPGGLGFVEEDLFIGGDIRVNEQIGLLAMHTLWVREHNRIADILSSSFSANDEDLYQMARKLVTAEIQAITYKEFLPTLIGDRAPDLDAYSGYQPFVNPGVAQEFATAAFRVGHTFLSESLLYHDGNGPTGSISLVDAFFTPGLVRASPNLVDETLIGQTIQAANIADVFVIEEVRTNLFGAPISGDGRDLVAFNIQRGRDNGLLKYNDVRAGYLLDRKTSFNDITSDTSVANSLSQAYEGDLEDCDIWICGLAEPAVNNGQLGELFSTIIADQFQRFMDGDEFFYLNDPDVRASAILNVGIDVDSVTLADVLNANTVGGVTHPAMIA